MVSERMPSDKCGGCRPRYGMLNCSPGTGTRRGRCDGMRAESWLYRVTVGLSGLALALVVAYIVLVQDNRSVQAEVNRRQQFINQSIQLGRISDTLIRALATAAVENNDDKLRELLAQNGISINPTTGAPEKQATPPAAPAGTGR